MQVSRLFVLKAPLFLLLLLFSSLGKKVFVTRIRTERPEAIESGTSILVGTDPKKIQKHVNMILKTKKTSSKREAKNLFGDGKAAKRIIDVIVKGRCEQLK